MKRASVLRVIDVVGRAFVVAGLLGLLFVGYQVWGTGLVTAREQHDLKAEFQRRLEQPGRAVEGDARPTPSRADRPVMGGAVAMIEIPKLSAEYAVVEGVGIGDLRKGPGHYPSTPLPGERGNAGIAGHRTTYGAPFGDLDKLAAGDPIEVTTVRGRFIYRVTEQLIVGPGDVEVLEATEDARLTLTTCHPRFSARERLVVVAELEEDASPAPAEPTRRHAAAASLDGEESGLGGLNPTTVGAGLAAAAAGGLWWAAYRRRRHWTTWLGGVVPCLALTLYFYVQVEQLLPANV